MDIPNLQYLERMARSLTLAVILVLGSFPVHAVTLCGVCLELEEEWSASVVHESATECEIGIRPHGWKSMAEMARWHEDDYAMRLQVLCLGFDEASSKMGFFFEPWGQSRWGVMDRGGIAEAEPVQYGQLMGWLSDGWFRGFAKEGAIFDGQQSHLYSGIWRVVLLRLSDDVFVGLQYSRWNPDIDLNRDCVAEQILFTLQPAPD